MEKTKLTVRVPWDLLDDAKRYARENNTSLSRLVSEYLRRLGTQDTLLADSPIVRRLTGVLPLEASVEEYHEYLEEKYGG